jgi:hypothetical protein
MSSSASAKSPNETAALHRRQNDAAQARGQSSRTLVRAASVLIVFIALGAVFLTNEPASWFGGGTLPLDPREAANVILSKAPVIVRSASTLQPIVYFLTPSPSTLVLLSMDGVCFSMDARMAILTLHGSCAWSMATT